VRTDRLLREYRIAAKYTFFPLHPETPEDGLSLEELFAGTRVDVAGMKAQLARLILEEGLPYGDRSHTYNSRLAQELGKWAEEQPGGGRIHHALYQAYFVNGINLAKIDALVGIAQAVGLPGEEARALLENRSYKAAVDRDWARAIAIGVRGVPTFLAGGRSVVGAQPYAVLEKLVVEAGAKKRGEAD
jgi:predicted DsbA family dithiol-disulfide isomerase